MSDATTETVRETLCRLNGDVDARVDLLEELRLDEDALDAQRRVFRALANEHRLQILAALREGERCVCELQVVLDAPQSTVATHLRELRDAGLVRGRRNGKWTYYRIADAGVLDVLDLALAMQEEA